MIGPVEIAAWLEARGVTPDLFVTDGEIPPAPDRLVIVQMTGGPGEKRERTFDELSVQIRTRGLQNVESSASALAWAADDALLGARPPITIGETYVVKIVRAGGPPSFVEKDPGGSAHYACSYLAEAARSVF